jgi:hypothetical protein
MKPKAVITVVLLLFVAASFAYLAVGELTGRAGSEGGVVGGETSRPTAAVSDPADAPKTPPETGEPSAGGPPEAIPPAGNTAPAVISSPDTYVTVYYFHGTYRCITCRTIEMYTREAVNEAFIPELGNGSLHLRVINMQDPENRAYVDDFGLEYYIVVLERVADGKRVEYKKLEGVWDLLGDKQSFKKYVIDETRDYLKRIDR